MGIDYIISSKTYPDVFQEKKYFKLVCLENNINWQPIFTLLNLNMGCIIDNAINYWTPEQIRDIYTMVQDLHNDPRTCLYGGWTDEQLEPHMKDDIRTAITLKDDIEKLCTYLKYLADHDAYIHIV